MWGILIPIVAIVGSFAIPITAIILDYRRRRLQYGERRAMIEKGMQPPPLEEKPLGKPSRTPEERRQKSLQDGIIMLFLGVGLGLGSYLLGYVFTESFLPDRFVPMLGLAGSIVGFLGLGNLVYYALAGKQVGGSGMPG